MKHLLFALLASAGAAACAQAQMAPTPYIGMGAAAADHNKFSPGSPMVIGQEGWRVGTKLFAGVDLDEHWGVEAGYTRFGTREVHWYNQGKVDTLRIKESSYYLAAKATLPVGEQLALFAKLGVAHNTSEVRATDTALDRNTSSNELYAALGGQVKLSERVALTAESERYGKNKDIKGNVLSVAAKLRF